MVLEQVFTAELDFESLYVTGESILRLEKSATVKYQLLPNFFDRGIKSFDVKIISAIVTFDDDSTENVTSFEIDNQVTTEAGFIIDRIEVDLQDKTITLY